MCQFHQHIMRSFFCTEDLCKAFLYLHFAFELIWHKYAHKMLMKLTTEAENMESNVIVSILIIADIETY